MTDAPPDPPDLDPASLAASDFTRSRRGLEPDEVHAALGRAADALRTWEVRDAHLLARIAALHDELEQSRELDESRIASVLGEETARIVTAARDAAAEIRSKAEIETEELRSRTEQQAVAAADAMRAEATTLRDEAARTHDEAVAEATRVREEADASAVARLAAAEARSEELLASAEAVLAERTAEAEDRAAELTTAAERIRTEAEQAAASARSAADAEADVIVEQARSDGREMIDEVRVARERILRDLAERRRVARRQIEGALAGRDQIVQLLRQTGADVAATVEGLAAADDAASEAADRAAAAVVADPERELGELREELGIEGDRSVRADPGSGGSAAAELDVGPTPAAEAREDALTDGGTVSTEAVSTEAVSTEAVSTEAVSSDDPASGGATVHDLFARIRGEESVDDSADGSADPVDDSAHPVDDATGSPGAEVAASAAPSAAPASGSTEVLDDPAIDLTEGAAGSDGPDGHNGSDGSDPVSAPDADGTSDDGTSDDSAGDVGGASVLDHRDELLAPVEKALARGLKRLASDEQNEILDRLRRVKRGRPDPAEILPTGADDAAWADALAPEFDKATEAGAALWSELAGTTGAAAPEGETGREVLDTRVSAFLSLHRAHLLRTFADADEDGVDPSELADRFRSAYRDLRSSLSEFAGDLAVAGFAEGERRAAGPGTPWQWMVDNGGLPCADGEDNALGGATPCEEPFPTGDLMPPAHPGCRCILVPARR